MTQSAGFYSKLVLAFLVGWGSSSFSATQTETRLKKTKEIADAVLVLEDQNQFLASIDFGSVRVGSQRSQTSGLGFCAQCLSDPNCNDPVTIGNVSVSNSSNFVIESDGCSGATVAIGSCCQVKISFKPTGAGSLMGSEVVGWHSSAHAGTSVRTLTGTGLARVNNTCQGATLSNASFVNVDLLSLGETIPLVGVPFSLVYASSRAPDNGKLKPKSFGLGGWMPSIMHFYDSSNHRIFYGNGAEKDIEAVSNSTGYFTVNDSGSEYYLFSSAGLHTETRDALTGKLRYSFSYDSSGKIVKISDRFSNTTSISYSSGGISVSSPYGQMTTVLLDVNGWLKSAVNPNNEAYQMTYSSDGKLLSFQKPGGQINTFTYDASGLLQKDQGAGGNFLSFMTIVDQATQTQSITQSTALNRTTSYQSFSADGASTHQTIGPDGSISSSSILDHDSQSSTDVFGNIYQSQRAQDPRFGWMSPYGSSSSYVVPGSSISLSTTKSLMAHVSDPANPLGLISLTTTTVLQGDSGRTFTSIFDATKNQWTAISPLRRSTIQKLNSMGQIASTQIGSLIPIQFSYDSRGRLIETAQASRKNRVSYSSTGNIASVVDPLERTTSFQYDNANRVVRQTLPDGSAISMTYDSNGNMTSVTPPGRSAHSFSYNLFELLAGYLPPSLAARVSGATLYSYNADKQMTQIARSDGTQIGMNYDGPSGNLTSVTTPAGIYSYQYGAKSSLVSSVTSPDGQVLNYQYAGNLPIVISSSGVISSSVGYSYNADGSLAAISVSGAGRDASTIAYSYDKDGLITGVGDLSFSLNEVGAIFSSKIGNIVENISYNKFGEKTFDSFVFGQKTLFNALYKRDKLGRVVHMSASDGWDNEAAYEYDQQGRLTKVRVYGRTVREYKYDGNGNRIESRSESGIVKATYDEQDRLLKYGSTEYRYNDSGDLLQKIENPESTKTQGHVLGVQKITSYTYDVFGNLKVVLLPSGKKIEYVVDGQNRRIGKKVDGRLVQAFVYQSTTQVAAELNGDGTLVKRFVYGSKSNVPEYMIYQGKKYRIISNQVGTPKLIVDVTNGRIVEEASFDEFGLPYRVDQESVLPFGFAGGLYDADTGLVRFGARDYDPETGRWTSKDPILFQGGSTNLFSYSANDPINFVDPSGDFAIEIGAGFLTQVGLVGGGAGKNFAFSFNPFTGQWQTGTTTNVQGNLGGGLYGGAGGQASLTLGADNLCSLKGTSGGIGGAAGVGLAGASGQVLVGSAGITITGSIPFTGAGAGVAGYGVISNTSVQVTNQGNLYNWLSHAVGF